MDYKDRLEELNNKLEREELTEAEQAELKLYYSMALLALRESCKVMQDIADKLYNELKK